MLGLRWDTSQLRRQQREGDPDGNGRRRWALLLGPLVLMVIGFLVALLTPVPSIGVLLVLVATFSLPVVALQVWRGQ